MESIARNVTGKSLKGMGTEIGMTDNGTDKKVKRKRYALLKGTKH